MKKLLGVLGSIFFFAVVLIAMGVGKIVGRSVGNAAFEPDTAEMLSQVSTKINGGLPMMVDAETRLDSTSPGPDNSFNYIYTLVHYPSGALDKNSISALATDVTGKVCASPQMQKFLALGVTAIYVYRGNDGVEVGRVAVKQSDCSQPRVVANAAPAAAPSPIDTPMPYAAPTPTQDPASVAANSAIAAASEVASVADSAVASTPPYDAAKQVRCNEQYQNALADIPADASLGDAANANNRAQRRYNSCMGE